MLKGQHACGFEVFHGARADLAKAAEAIGTREQRPCRFKASRTALKCRVILAHIRRVADDDVKTFSRKRGEPVILTESDSKAQLCGLLN